MRVLNRLAVVLILLLVALPAAAGQTWQLTILHTNDLHGMMQPFEYESDVPALQDARGDLGGLARRATLIQRIRRETATPVVVMDAGDFFARGPWHTQWYGVPEVEAMNLMGYDMLSVGNNELKPIWDDPRSKDMMLSLMRRSRFPWLAANITLGDGPPPGCDAPAPVEGIHPFVVRAFGDVRVAFLGLTTPASAEYPHMEGWTIGDPIEAARHWIPIARQECDLLIVVSHLGFGTDQQLAAEVPGIDAIVGGHSHTFTTAPEWVESPAGTRVPVVQAGEHGVVLGRLDLTFEHTDAWRLTKAESALLPIDDALPELPGARALLAPYCTAREPALVPALAPAS